MLEPLAADWLILNLVSETRLDYLDANRAHWESRRNDQLELARRQWSASEPSWGVFGISESDANVLPDGLEGTEVVELGCGTAYVSAWLARRGASPVAVDPTRGQLRIAREFQQEFGIDFPLVQAAGEQVPLRDESFDFAVSEYGAALWADPYMWIPEAARLLRPGGQLLFLSTSTLLAMCMPDEEDIPASEHLLRDQFGMYRMQWPDDLTVEFHLGHGDRIRLLRSSGFEIENLIELRPSPDAKSDYDYASVAWARRWPCEEVWVARKL